MPWWRRTGIQETTVSSVVVQVDQVTHVEIVLEVGNVTESVQVEAAAPLLESDKSTISSVVDNRTIASMPLNARQYLDLALLTPGAIPSQPGQQGVGFNMAGARSQSNLFLLDGVSNMDTQIGSALGNFACDAVQKFTVQPACLRGLDRAAPRYRCQAARASFGSVFEYLRNSISMRRTFSPTVCAVPRTLHRNQYGDRGRIHSPRQELLLRFWKASAR
jgi:hypothetical protein